MTNWLDAQSILVTGGGSGIGRAQVERFLAEGAFVTVLERDPARCDAVRGTFGDAVEVVMGDATVLADNECAVERATSRFGTLDVVVANTGIWDFCTPLADLPADDRLAAAFDELFRVNVLSYLLIARASMAALHASQGSLILTSSQAGFHPGGGGPLYVASKHAVVGLVRQLAYEFAPLVRVNGVAPGGWASALRGPAALGLDDRTVTSLPLEGLSKELSPLGFLPEAHDYVGVYVLLASRQNNRTTTGEVIECDGGERVRGRRATEIARQHVSEAAVRPAY